MDELQPGESVEGYTILEVMRAFPGWAAYHAIEMRTGREVMIKASHADAVTQPEARERFIREAGLLGHLSHPNLVAYCDCVIASRGAFLIHEFVHGATLAEALEAHGPIAPWDAVAMLAPVLDAVASIHALGAVHRDLTPQTLVRAPSGIVKLIDLGCVKTPDEGWSTRLAHAVGTYGYQSPEQIMGRPVDGRADIFSFGVTLFELTTGRKPFGTRPPAAHVEAVRKGPEARAEALVPGYPKPLADALQRAVDLHPGRRHQTAEELKNALLASIAAAPPGSTLALDVLSGSRQGARVALGTVPDLTIGRAADNHLALEDQGVSQHHLVIGLAEGRLCIRDLQSTNGTFVNGTRVVYTYLEPGDMIGIGSVLLRCAKG